MGTLALTVRVLEQILVRLPYLLFRRLTSARSVQRRTLAVRHSEGGQNLLEFALLTPVVLAFIAAIVAFGLALNTRSSLQQAVREGARQAAVGKPLADVQALAAGNAAENLDPADVKWCLPAGSTGIIGQSIRVYIDDDASGGVEGYDFTLVPSNGIFAAFGVPDLTISMKPRATARLEGTVVGVPPCT